MIARQFSSLRPLLFHYRVCGLSVVSDFALPGLVNAPEWGSATDVRVRRGATPRALEGERRVGPTWRIAETSFLFQVPKIARFLVADGRDIVVERRPAATDADVAPFLLGTAFGVLLHQRGQLVFHAATVSYRGRGLALCGPSGVGKSTLAAALCRVGCDFVGDDVAALRFEADGTPTVLPDGRQHRLWADSAEQLGLADRLGPPVRPCIKKFHVDPPTEAVSSTPLTAVFILREALSPLHPKLAALAFPDAAPLMRGEVYRPKLASHLGRDADLFRQIAALIGRVRVFRLDRMMDFAALDDTVAAVLAQMDGKA